jgi:hypothetical protein
MIIEIPDTVTLSEQFKKLSQDEIVKVIQIGEYIYFNGLSQYDNIEKEKYEFAYQKQIEDMRYLTDKQIREHAESVMNQYNMIVETKEKLIISKTSEIDELKSRIIKLEDENCQALSLSGKLDSLMGKGNTVDNAMKGDFGESIVANQIQHWYQASELEDTSAETAKGDLLWKLNDGDFRALVEVKNVQMVRPLELQKFERDMLLNTKDKSCNCGLFVSLKTETIPNKGKFKLEFLNNCPIIYVSNILDDLNTLRFALDSLCSIQQKLKYMNTQEQSESDNDIDLEEQMIDFVQKQFNKIDSIRVNVSQMKTSINTLNMCIENEEKFVRDLLDGISYLKSECDIFKQIETEYKVNTREELKESILRDMRLFYEENGRKPVLNDLTHKYKISIFRDDLAFKKLKNEL